VTVDREMEKWRRDLDSTRRAVDTELRRQLAAVQGMPARLRRAMGHSLFGGGKRLRPILLLWTWAACRSGTREPRPGRSVLAAAAALEMIHTYSLIHDDLPAMDDDVLRRGRPTCHVAFDEATAILAGDALQALAFEILAGIRRHGAELVRIVARAAGPAGMVGGQMRDMEADRADAVGATAVRRIHLDKTGRLIAAPLVCGALLADVPAAARRELERAGLDLGLAFQARDDLLDATATTAQLGKTAGKDAASGKATLVTTGGLEYAARQAQRRGRSGIRRLERTLPAGPRTERLLRLAHLLWTRGA